MCVCVYIYLYYVFPRVMVYIYNVCVCVYIYLLCISQSDGVAQTRFLATQHAKEAVRLVKQLKPSDAQTALVALTEMVLKRTK